MSGFTPEEFAKFVAFAKRMEQEEPKQKSRVTEIFETPEKPAKATPFRDDTDEEEVEINLKNDFLIQEYIEPTSGRYGSLFNYETMVHNLDLDPSSKFKTQLKEESAQKAALQIPNIQSTKKSEYASEDEHATEKSSPDQQSTPDQDYDKPTTELYVQVDQPADSDETSKDLDTSRNLVPRTSQSITGQEQGPPNTENLICPETTLVSPQRQKEADSKVAFELSNIQGTREAEYASEDEHATENSSLDEQSTPDQGSLHDSRSIHFLVHHKKLTDECINELIAVLGSYKILAELEFRNSELEENSLCRLKDGLGGKCKIKKLSIGYTDTVKGKLHQVCDLIVACSTTSLRLEYDELEDKDLKILQKCLQSLKTELEELDVSYNDKIGSKGFQIIGEIMQEHKIGKLKVSNCGISDDKFAKLRNRLTYVTELDLSGSKMTEQGYTALANFMKTTNIKILNLSRCHMTRRKFRNFYKTLRGSTVQLKEFNVSYNNKINTGACRTIGLLVWNCGVRILSLAGCNLNEHNLKSFAPEGKTKMEMMNFSDNASIGLGIFNIGEIVSNCEVEKLDISDCMLTGKELKSFKTALKDTKLKILDLSDPDRTPDDAYIKEVCELLPNVTEEFRLHFRTLSRSCRRILEGKHSELENSELRIILNEDTNDVISQ